ncbi:MAG: carbohydrate ABC transporter permease [Saccharofermentanales bacterium]
MRSIKSKVGRRANHSIYGDFGVLIFLSALGLFMIIPFIYSIVQSLKPIEELFVFPPKFFVRNPTGDNFINLLLSTNNMWVPFERYIVNSIYMTLAGSAGSVILASMAAYPLAKFVFPGSRMYFRIITLSLLFVYEVTYIPQYILLSRMGFIDSPLAIILPAFASSLGLFLMKQFMSQIPDSLVEAATVDGASTWTTFWKLIMPNVKPAWLTAFILSFQSLWNRDTSAFIFTEQLKNLPAMFRQISVSNTIATVGIASAAAVILMIPPILVFLFSQSRILETMAYSGIKG